MNGLLQGCLLLSLASASPDEELLYGFATKDYFIELRITFPKAYLGKRLVFYNSADPTKEVCYSADDGAPGKCVERFTGALAVVKYSVKPVSGGTPAAATIREHVTVTGQSPGLPERAPLWKTQRLIKGIGSDIQAFGYDELGLKQADRARMRKAREALWRSYRQELYVDQETKPFAIVEWKHTLRRVSITNIYSPPDRE